MKRSASFTYTVNGILFGCLFPLIATLWSTYDQHQQITWELMLQIQKTESLLWIIDTAPFFLGLFAWIAGNKQDRIRKINNTLEDRVREQSEGLIEVNKELTKEIEDRKKKEEELIEARLEAEQGVRAKDQFLSNMSHEIRTPMNGILGMTDLLLDTRLDHEQQQYLSAIQYSAKNLLVIINEILDLSKINSEKLELERINFTLDEVFKSVENMFQFKASEKGVELDINMDKEVPQLVSGDPVRFGQILLNIVGNAVKFTDQGKVGISCHLVENDESGYCLKVVVKDTGIGIAAEDIEKIFQDFAQANTSITREYGGTGLGLSIAQRLIDLFRGDLYVESEEGNGSTFSFTVNLHPPLEDTGESKSKRGINRQLIDKSSIRVLLVEDNKINQMVAENFLKKRGFTADIALNGQEAIEKISNVDYDLILMDIQMPVMDGLTATRHIRSQLSSPQKDVKIMAMTASVLKHEIDRCFEAGMNDYIAKPFDPEELYSKILKLVN